MHVVLTFHLSISLYPLVPHHNRYNDNPFHNFEHASHVMMSVVKLLSRIVAPNAVLEALETPYEMSVDEQQMQNKIASTLHDHTYGITSDPLTQFAVVFSALIHDVDHQGIPNTTLVQENAMVASLYNGKSVAEQNSFDLAWDMLMDPCFTELRGTICGDVTEANRFRQLVVNTVLATDIMDKDLKALRNKRWETAFSSAAKDNTRDNINRKATIVIEHLIQASDVAHTMQHWHVYRKWNERLFCEMYKAYQMGRAEKNPADFWYQGEIGFLDFYIIPLAKKLKDCGVFGVSSDEYLQYATENRREWEARGKEVVADFVQKMSIVDPDKYDV
jgi:3'5'-cyclic nucleotide phosphodiesterase